MGMRVRQSEGESNLPQAKLLEAANEGLDRPIDGRDCHPDPHSLAALGLVVDPVFSC
jgi:hypothetical protein